MNTQTEEENWPEPGTTGHSFWNPSGPFRPLRRILLWLLIGSFALAVVGFAGGLIGATVLILSGMGTLMTAWVVLWFIDTILAYLKR